MPVVFWVVFELETVAASALIVAVLVEVTLLLATKVIEPPEAFWLVVAVDAAVAVAAAAAV